ncbi:MAG: hypothetical protein WCL50_00370 [Spirochaetota bacterium]
MKKLGILLLGAAFVSFAFTGCEQLLADYAKKADYATKADVTAVTGQNSTCMGCHNATTTSTAGVQSLNPIGANILAAQGEYAESGHFNGYRELIVTNATSGAADFEAPSSNAMYANNSGCARCHTAQGFIQYALGGAAAVTDQPWSSQTSCQTCHQPHKTGDMTTLRTTATGATGPAAVTLVDKTTIFDKGDGNLCANCHQARGVPSADANFTATATNAVTTGTIVAGTATFTSSTTKPTVKDAAATPVSLMMMSRATSHHGPNSDMLMGVGGVIDSSVTVSATNPSPHYSASTDSCVTCHMYKAPAGSSTSGTLAIGGHGTYLTDVVHGVKTDFVATCKQCHVSGTTTGAKAWPSTATYANPNLGVTFDQSNHTATADFDGNTKIEDILVEIQGLEKTLITYFGNGANFYTATFSVNASGSFTQYALTTGAVGEGAVIAAKDTVGAATTAYSSGSGIRWLTDWQYQSYTDPMLALNKTTSVAYTGKAFPYMTSPQAKAFANLQYVMEDKSLGVHNPSYVAKMLYSSIKLINANSTAALTIGATAP